MARSWTVLNKTVYESVSIDIAETTTQTTDAARELEKRENASLHDENDAQEQYSRRNCLLLHGVPETQVDTDNAVLSVTNEKLGLNLTRDCIDRSHRLGQAAQSTSNGKLGLNLTRGCIDHSHRLGQAAQSTSNGKLGLNLTRDCIDRSHRLGQSSSASNGKPQPIIVKLTSYDTRRKIFGAKQQLKGTRLVITENLTKRRSELLQKARSVDGVVATWTIDGRIVCLVGNGQR